MVEIDDEGKSDAELWLSYRDGDRASFSSFYRRHAAAVLKYGWSISGDQADAEEVLQETFLTAWDKRRTSIIVDNSLLPWLLTICRNHSRNLARRRRKHRATPLHLVDAATPDGDLTWIAVEVSKLSLNDQELCRLCLVEGFTYAQAAEAMGTSTAAIGKRLQRLRARLVRSMAENE